jgi:hypothetical protein
MGLFVDLMINVMMFWLGCACGVAVYYFAQNFKIEKK